MMKYTKTRISACLLLLFLYYQSKAQYFHELPSLPEPVTNNAVCGALVTDTAYVYSFMGLDSTKLWSGIHLKSWRYNTISGIWQALPPVPDPSGGLIAAAASTVKNRIYVIGGYSVAQNGSETSSNKVHRFDPQANTWLTNGADIPVPIDDQVQAVWRDSLIFVVTGWSNNGNVPNVQIYNPSTDSWMAGTPVPNTVSYKVFGASGIIKGDTLFYCGGARSGSNFPATTIFRKGYIHPDDPSQIDWSFEGTPVAKGYRMAVVQMAGGLAWIGGSDITYNYDGIAYNGSGPVPALARAKTYYDNEGLVELDVPGLFPAIMDLRGAAQLSTGSVITAGGIGPDNKVSDKVYSYLWAVVVPNEEAFKELDIQLKPNPVSDYLLIYSPITAKFQLLNNLGIQVATVNGSGQLRINMAAYPGGTYYLQAWEGNQLLGTKTVLRVH